MSTLVTKKTWQEWLERLYSLRRDKRGSHERPHKPVLLLSILDLLDRGVIAENRVPLSGDSNLHDGLGVSSEPRGRPLPHLIPTQEFARRMEE